MTENQSAHHGTFLRFSLLKVQPEWRRLDVEQRQSHKAEFASAIEKCSQEVETFSYSTQGIRAEGELLLWQTSPSLESLQQSASHIFKSGLGQYMETSISLLGIIRPSHYVKKQSAQEQALSEPERLKYLIVYPFVKTTDWYLYSRETRQGMMNEHIRVGHEYASVRQVLAYSFGVDDQEFVVTYETDVLEDFQDLVMALRATEARRYTMRDTPILVGIYHQLEDALNLIG